MHHTMKNIMLVMGFIFGMAVCTMHAYSADESLVVTESGNVGIGVTNPTEKFDVGGLLKADSVNGVVQTSKYVKEFSGIIFGPGNYPQCDAPEKIVTIGNVKKNTVSQTFITIELFGSHRGYCNNNVYFDYKKWIIMAGDRISSNLGASSGGGDKVKIYNGQNEGDYNNIAIGDSGFDIRLKVNPQCGANMNYTYIVRYYSNAQFSPNITRSW